MWLHKTLLSWPKDTLFPPSLVLDRVGDSCLFVCSRSWHHGCLLVIHESDISTEEGCHWLLLCTLCPISFCYTIGVCTWSRHLLNLFPIPIESLHCWSEELMLLWYVLLFESGGCLGVEVRTRSGCPTIVVIFIVILLFILFTRLTWFQSSIRTKLLERLYSTQFINASYRVSDHSSHCWHRITHSLALSAYLRCEHTWLLVFVNGKHLCLLCLVISWSRCIGLYVWSRCGLCW